MAKAHPHDLGAATERRIGEAFARKLRDPDGRERLGNLAFAAGFALVAAALAWRAPHPDLAGAPLALAFTAAYAAVARVEFSVGTGYGVPTQLVFLPMLLLLPVGIVPLLVAGGLVLSAGVEAVRGRTPWRRLVLAIANAWFAVGPALVLALADAGRAEWRNWPVYVLAILAQFGLEALVSLARGRICWQMGAGEVVSELSGVFRVDGLLAPVGLLAGLAAAPVPAAALLVLPLVALIGMLAQEREGRIAHSLELGRAYRGTALLLRDLLEEDDEYTGHHTEDVVELSVRVAEELRVDEDVQRETELGALLHDIGKIHIPDAIINKPGKLDADEWAIMKTHTVAGQKMLDQVGGLLGSVGLVVRASHERYDGGGYPDGLAGEAIPLAARIVSACDAFNAMTTTRSYRKALPLSVAVQELRDNSGTQFDAQVVEALLAVVGDPGWEASLVPAPAPAPARAQVPAA